MTLKMFGVIASVSVVALTLSTLEASARGGRGGVPGAPIVRPGVKPFLHHHGRGFGGGFFPGGGFYYGDGSYGDGSYGGPLGGTSLPMTNDVTYTTKQDVPWDWAHRFPPNVVPSDRPYVSSCSNEVVTVPGRSGEQTVNVMRCY
jgi:hypothetical protein